MVKVAIAGGTGHTGLHIAEAIVAAGKHELIVLSRQTSHPVLDKLGVPIVTVDYADPSSLDRALSSVHTVISTISGMTADQLATPQLALLDAAVRSGVVRFAPSEFGTRAIPDNPVELYRPKWPVLDAVMRSGLEYTVFEVGLYMNILASGTPGVGHLPPMRFMFDVEKCTATIPGDGTASVVYTRIEDVGRFVAASLDLDVWPQYSQMRGDRMTYNEVLQIAEGVRGKKFQTTYLSKEQLLKIIDERRDKVSDLQKMFAQWWLEVLGDNPVGYEGKNLNDLCPEVQPMGIKEFLNKWWSKAE